MELFSIVRLSTLTALRRHSVRSTCCNCTQRNLSLTAAVRGTSGDVNGEEGAASETGANRTGKTKVLYDGDCPLCIQEIKFVRFLNRKKGAIHFVDLSKPGYNPSEHSNIPLDEAMGIMHVIGPDNTVHKRVDALHAMYSAVGHAWLTGYMKWPLLAGLFDRGYLWFARNRLWLTRRQCEAGTCKVPDR